MTVCKSKSQRQGAVIRTATTKSALVLLLAAALPGTAANAAGAFAVEEITIDGIHQAIRDGEVSCAGVVQAYIDRTRAYNGVCTQLVTADGAPIPEAKGRVLAGEAVTYPTETVPIAKVLPDYKNYQGPTPDLGYMQATVSDPAVAQQYGIVRGIANARKVNALETLNIRGERSVSCQAECDAASGALPAHCPSACEEFRKLPDALEYARSLDNQYGTRPDLAAMPLYCVPLSLKAVYDVKDMRSIGGADADYAMDAPPRDGTLAERLRAKGAIMFAKAVNSEYNGGSGNPGGDAKESKPYIVHGGSRDTWGGTTCNPYNTERITGGSSGGSGVSVAANLVACSICETTGGSCRSPATHNNVVNLVPTKGMTSYGGGIGADPFRDRPGVNCRTVKDAVTVFEAFRDDDMGFFDPRDPYSALTRMTASQVPYTEALKQAEGKKPLAGMRIGVIRELFIKHDKSDAAISDGINAQLKVLQDLGATLVEATTPDYPDDRSMANMAFTVRDAMAEVLPFHMPEVFSWKQEDGTPEFAVEGWDVTSRAYLVALANRKAPLPENLGFNRMMGGYAEEPDSVSGYTFSFQMAQYLNQRGDEKVYNWETLNQNASYFSDAKHAAMVNWANKPIDPATYDTTFTMKRRYVMRMAMMKVMEQNKIDVFANPSGTTLQNILGGAREPRGGPGQRRGFGYGARLGIPEVFVPAGFASEIYEPVFELAKDGKKYDTKTGSKPTKLKDFPLPYNIAFWAAPGDLPDVIKVAAAFEAATKHRRPPPGFGPVSTGFKSTGINLSKQW